MGVLDNRVSDLIDKVGSWRVSMEMSPDDDSCRVCEVRLGELCHKYSCQGCRKLLCGLCVRTGGGAYVIIAGGKDGGGGDCVDRLIRACGYCRKSVGNDSMDKIYPEMDEDDRMRVEEFRGRMIEFKGVDQRIECCVSKSPTQSDEEGEEESRRHYFSSTSEYYQDNTNTDIDISVSFRSQESYSVGSTPVDSPSRSNINTPRAGRILTPSAVLKKPRDPDETERHIKPLDFDKNDCVWYPPPPEDEDDESERSFFGYDDDDDEEMNNVIGVSNGMFSCSSSSLKQVEGHKEPFKAVIHGHFRALVSQLLQGGGIRFGDGIDGQDWLDIISSLAWQAANFVRPDTSKGGSMDPVNYVKIKCVASGRPNDSSLVKGIVCTKNIKHKRMTSQYNNPRLLLLGGSLEYQRAQNQLASFNTLLEEEMNHLKMIVSKIEAHRTNVLLVEKSVSSYAQEYLLAKEISLVLNVKRPLLEQIARCTGASITSVNDISGARLGQCELFRLEKVLEELEEPNQYNRKPSKTLMYFEGCPRRLGCTVLIKGMCREELKKIKHVVQYAVFAAYHLSLETSFLADEGAHLPKPDTVTESREETQAQLSVDSETKAKTCSDVNPERSFRESSDGSTCREHSDGNLELENEQSILVSFSSRCVPKATLCERSRLLRIRYYGSFDKPLGRYLRDDLFDQVCVCHSCKEPVEAHVQCYTHRQGSLTINVRRLDSVKLRGEREGKIWMWHRCLRCAEIDGVPPATRRVIMSDAAWGLSFGKFLELSFSNHATANRVAGCGHSLQRDCLRFYGFGSMVAFFHYSPIDILTVHLPPPMIECDGRSKQQWITREVEEIKGKMETVYAEISSVLSTMEQKSLSSTNGSSDTNYLYKQIQELKGLLVKERDDYHGLLLGVEQENSQSVDIFELNRLRRSLLIGSHAWDRQLYSLDSLLNSKNPSPSDTSRPSPADPPIESNNGSTDDGTKVGPKENSGGLHEPMVANLERVNDEDADSPASDLSDKIDSAWTGTDAEPPAQPENLPLKRLMAPVRVYSFDSAMRIHEKNQRNVLSSHLSAVRSFHVSGDYQTMVRADPVSFIPSVSQMAESPRLLLPGEGNSVISIYDDEPTSVISYALTSKQYENHISNNSTQQDESSPIRRPGTDEPLTPTFLSWQSFGSLDLDYISYGGYGSSEDLSSRNNTITKRSPHLQINFDDANVRFSVTCYFAEMFDTLRRKCCRSHADFVCSMSRCRRWSAQGGKSNVYFAKTMDERFIVKQVTKTELDSFQEFAAQYFKYLNDSVDTGSPTCLAKILGIFQVTIKHLKGGKETKMDLMVMENLFFNRRVSQIYDLKGSLRSRYNPDTSGSNKVLLDMNLLETLRTNPIFLGSKAKRRLERAVWNDTSFLASVDVMDYSLLVGVDEERKELVLGIIDFMRQYTWDKHLETWVKASGILGGSKNASPTIISPKQYKKRFRKAMTSYFLTVPDQWSL